MLEPTVEEEEVLEQLVVEELEELEELEQLEEATEEQPGSPDDTKEYQPPGE